MLFRPLPDIRAIEEAGGGGGQSQDPDKDSGLEGSPRGLGAQTWPEAGPHTGHDTSHRAEEEPTRAGRPRGHKRRAQTLGCGGSTRHNPSGRWKAVTAGVPTPPLGPRALLKPPHSPTRRNSPRLDSPRPSEAEPRRRKGNLRKQGAPAGFNPLLSVWRLVGRAFTRRGTGARVPGSRAADTAHRSQQHTCLGPEQGRGPEPRAAGEPPARPPPWVSGDPEGEHTGTGMRALEGDRPRDPRRGWSSRVGLGEAAAPSHGPGRARGRNPGRGHRTKSAAARGWEARGGCGPSRSRTGWRREGRAAHDQGLWRPGLGGHEDQPGWKEGLI